MLLCLCPSCFFAACRTAGFLDRSAAALYNGSEGKKACQKTKKGVFSDDGNRAFPAICQNRHTVAAGLRSRAKHGETAQPCKAFNRAACRDGGKGRRIRQRTLLRLCGHPGLGRV